MSALTFQALRRLADGRFHSGEEMARSLNRSRATLSEALKRAPEMGIELFSIPGKGYRVAALFTRAARAADKGDSKGAAAIYAGIAADQGVAQPYRDAALIRQTLIEYDSLAPQQVIDRLKPLTTEDNAFFGTAGELTAIAMMRLNRSAEAGRLLAAVAQDAQTPSSLCARAGRLATSLGGLGVWIGLAVGLVLVAALLLSRWRRRGRLGLLPAQP